jgi:hypothetical protein
LSHGGDLIIPAFRSFGGFESSRITSDLIESTQPFDSKTINYEGLTRSHLEVIITLFYSHGNTSNIKIAEK